MLVHLPGLTNRKCHNNSDQTPHQNTGKVGSLFRVVNFVKEIGNHHLLHSKDRHQGVRPKLLREPYQSWCGWK